MIGTHDSATGERGRGLLSWLVTPFARTQRKTIREQYEAGCRVFDIRVRNTRRGWVCAHGVWTSHRTATDILSEIDRFPERCQVDLTYEGGTDDRPVFERGVELFKGLYEYIRWGECAIKYGREAKGLIVRYEVVYPADRGCIGGEQGFLPLDGRSWHTYLPIPWLWDIIYFRRKRAAEYNKLLSDEKKVTYVDFL